MDPMTLGAVALVAAAVLAAVLWPAGKPAASRAPAHPGRALIDHFEEVGRDQAGRIVAERLGLVEADHIAEKFGRAFRPAAPAALPPPAGTPPAPNP